METVRCKLTVNAVKDYPETGNKESETVYFDAQYSDNPEDNTFSKYTPSANMTMNISNPAVYGFFEAGKKYYFDITKAD